MAGPPDNYTPTDLWTTLVSSERPSKVCDFPRVNESGEPIGQIRIRVLTQNEQMASAKAANDTAKALVKDGKRGDLGFERLFSDAYTIETLFRACRSVDDPKAPAFPSPKDMRDKLTTEECAMLFGHYATAQLELGPTALTLSQEEMDAWIDRLKEGGSGFPFNTLPSDLQKLLLLRMAYRLRKSEKEDTSAGSLLEETI